MPLVLGLIGIGVFFFRMGPANACTIGRDSGLYAHFIFHVCSSQIET